MIKKLLFLICTGFSVLSFCQSDEVLFIGNSVTYFNDMPEIFKNIAASKGKNLSVTTHTPGGTGFVNHVDDASLYQKIRSKNYKYVIMQPGTAESAGHSYPVSVTAERGRKIRDSIRKYSPCSKIFLYEIPYGVPSANEYNTYFAFQKKIKDSITKMSNLMQVEMVPAGESARHYYNSSQDLALHGSYNDIHPGPKGSYLVAATMYSAIFQDHVFPSTFYNGMPQNTAENFQNIADLVFFNNPPQWNSNTFHLHSDFIAGINGTTVNFTNHSANYTSVSWNFGDGITDSSLNPVHQYTAPGTYTVSLTVSKNSCAETFSKTITIGSLGTADMNVQPELIFYPNPVKDVAYIISKEKVKEIIIYNSEGRRVSSISGTEIADHKINFSQYQKGMYIVNIIFQNNQQKNIKIFK
ncbi:PKD domain-containing protein [Chryseobacterium cucumeris]|uniref:PKD domain-containing protein n=1 Tax=Chryseobacterium cucumeris TaxID=1813611 RepID=UPI002454EC37|nr:PKD domain-containing protein [Chryseobacterium cucumeris]MDH5032857.1 PKD domain-containing protein [Chryseobacterium cucumeris]